MEKYSIISNPKRFDETIKKIQEGTIITNDYLLLLTNLWKTTQLNRKIDILKDDGAHSKHFAGKIEDVLINDKASELCIKIQLDLDQEKEAIDLPITEIGEKTVQAVSCYKYYISNRPDCNTTIINFVTNEDIK
ncbi:hypothetical protein [Clostridium tyrobutyricum]|uniref:hypothetical protein n=1 Tax=Clostridium tyrobutyricum TaxID=1519 RepID=UPI00057CCA32|nr:hypothetical protein [Clostridium tyrobutyricum]